MVMLSVMRSKGNLLSKKSKKISIVTVKILNIGTCMSEQTV